MKRDLMVDAIGNLDNGLLEKHFQVKCELKERKSKGGMIACIKWTSLAACFCVAVAISIWLLISQFDGRLNGEYPDDIQGGTADGGYKFVTVEADWPYYDTAKEVVDASSNVYLGRVTDISFTVMDPSGEGLSRMLYTVYTVTVTENYKGEHPAEVKLCVMGGLKGYKEREQYELMEQSGLASMYRGIVVCHEDGAALAVGSEYLFCTSSGTDDFDHIINPLQFAHYIDSPNGKKLVRECEN